MDPTTADAGRDGVVTNAESPRGERGGAHSPQRPSGSPPPVPRRGAPRFGFWRWFVHRLLAAFGNPPLAIVLPNGEEVAGSHHPPTVRLRVHDRRTLWRLLLDPGFQFGEGYADGRISIDGDLLELLRIVDHSLIRSQFRAKTSRALARWRRRPHRNTLAGSRDNIHRHYDIGNDFYRLWLDEQLVYTCAYFETDALSLEAAQVAKMDHVCRKLRLKPGEHVIEAGCGWGALALHMARHWGVTVTAYNISHEQVAEARRKARDEGLADRVEFIEDDWRSIRGRCAAFVSVGMLEHVGLQNYEQLGRVIDGCLDEHGRGLIHSIGQDWSRPFNEWAERRIFPGAYPPTLREMMEIFEPSGFSVRDVENLRLHYAETLRHWLERYEQTTDEIREMFDDRFVRMWRLYLAASVASFETGWLQLFQIVFSRGRNNHFPRTRAHQYAHLPPEHETQLWDGEEASP